MVFDFMSVGSWTLIYSSPKSLIYRAYRKLDRQPFVIKVINNTLPIDRQLILLRDRYTTLDNLNLNGVIQLYSLEYYRDRYTLVMEDGGISLLEYSKSQPLPIEHFLRIAIKLAEIFAELYPKQVIHKDIKPSHILINPDTQEIKLIDFSIASFLPRKIQTIKNPNLLEGTLAYLSPEQTGRMNRGIDYRTDLYSLGVTFYQLLTGQLPFQSNEAIELVHCHLAKIPLPVHQVNPQIPIALSNIVSKLMAKNAEDRYQNALGLKYDLQQCLTQWQTTGNITEFAIAKRDRRDPLRGALRDRFLIPEKLYGRENEVQTLLNAFEKVASGNSELLLIAGYSGIGKTAIVNEIHKPIVQKRGYFIQGKFDQFNRHVPLSALVQAFRGLIRQILGETDKQLEQWKSRIIEALGENGRVIVEVIPELEKIIGVQPNPLILNGDAAQNRFNLLFEKFIQVFAQKEHPLVIFLDDLQWADSASLDLIKLLSENNNKGYLLSIGAYRDNEVDDAHPLMLTIAKIDKTKTTVNKINLAPLTELQVNRLVADTLNCSEEIAFPLTRLVYRKTQGNPFFTDRFLKTLQEDELITFNFDLGLWESNLKEIQGLTITDDVVEFVMIQLQKLPKTSQEILKIAACLGNQFDLKTLAIASKKTETEISENLGQLLEEGLILPKSDNYKYCQNWDFKINNLELDIAENTVNYYSYKFLHDRIQQAAYSLLAEEEKPATHYHIGNLLLNNFSETEREVHLFEIVGHLNRGLSLIKATDEREKLIQLNLMAARKARTATAYGAAVNYCTTAIDLLVADAWKTNYELTLTLHNERLESACLNKDYEKLSELGETILQNATSILDTIPVYESLIAKARSQGDFFRAIAIGLQVLKLLGVEFPQQLTPEDIAEAAAKTRQLWQEKSPLSLLNLPSMNDPHQIAMMQIMTSLSASAFIANPPLLLLLVFKQVELSINNGNCPISIFAYADYGVLLCGMFQDIDGGYEFTQLALSLLEQYQIKAFKSRVYFIVNAFIRHWKEPLDKCIAFLLEGYKSGLETGNWENVALNLITYSVYKYYGDRELKELSKEINNYGQFIKQSKEEAALKQHEVLQQAILNLLGDSEVPYYLNGAIFNAKQTIPL
jgi:predicted ATPase